jgi:hypothetical protein
METIFSQVGGRPGQAEIKRSIGRGDEVCEFYIKIIDIFSSGRHPEQEHTRLA